MQFKHITVLTNDSVKLMGSIACFLCELYFEKGIRLSKHMNIHIACLLFCSLCAILFKTMRSINRHKVTPHAQL